MGKGRGLVLSASGSEPEPLVLLNAVGLTRRLLDYAPRLSGLAKSGWSRTLGEVWPSVTCSAQATMLTGREPSGHGIVGNGWLFRDTREVRFWQQSNALLEAEPVYETIRRRRSARGMGFRAAKLFWWFNQGARVDVSATPKPHYGADGSKAFGITGRPEGFTEELEGKLGRFPFAAFWGPMAGLASTAWIAEAAGETLRTRRPDLTLAYLPHLDYDPQRFGPSGCDMARLTGELDASCEPLLDAAREFGARVWVVSEYGHCDTSLAATPNRALRSAGLLKARPGPFGEMLETFESRAFAVCDHQLAHVYTREASDAEAAREALSGLKGVARILSGEERAEIGLDHPRAGELILISERDAWFAYPYWREGEDANAPDFARTVDIHRKPGYDPCELFFDPRLRFPKLRVARRLLARKLGFRNLLDVIPLDAGLARGSHGIPAERAEDRPILIGDGPAPEDRDDRGGLPMRAVRDLLLEALAPE